MHNIRRDDKKGRGNAPLRYYYYCGCSKQGFKTKREHIMTLREIMAAPCPKAKGERSGDFEWLVAEVSFAHVGGQGLGKELQLRQLRV